jgi:acetyl esterase/lipase
MRTKVDIDPMVHPTSSMAYSHIYLAGQDARTPLASPLFANIKGLPPLLILVAPGRCCSMTPCALQKRRERQEYQSILRCGTR